MSTTKPTGRRWLQFSLRTLLLGVLLVAVFFGGRASVHHLIEAEKNRADKAEREARRANALWKRAIAQHKVVEIERKIERLEWEQEQVKLESLDRNQGAQRRRQELDRIRDAMERQEIEQRLKATDLELP
ncbi:MAG TPA: hypothetical protein VFB96_12680 [Pirellulaceae bacterium]|nr:hypothetical protein [Pirellulaceae bacterium]